MPPSDALVLAANTALADPNVRESVRQMHAASYPLVQMVEALGLDDEMSAAIRQILEGLAPDVVEGIRQATLAALDAAPAGGAAPELPLDCQLTPAQLEGDVHVEVSPVAGAPKIHVRSASKG